MRPEPLQVLASVRKCHEKLQAEFVGYPLNDKIIRQMNNYVRDEFRSECFLNSWEDMSNSLNVERGTIEDPSEVRIVTELNSKLYYLMIEGFSIEHEIAEVVDG